MRTDKICRTYPITWIVNSKHPNAGNLPISRYRKASNRFQVLIVYYWLHQKESFAIKAVSECSFHTLNTEQIHHHSYQTGDEVKRYVFENIKGCLIIVKSADSSHLPDGFKPHL